MQKKNRTGFHNKIHRELAEKKLNTLHNDNDFHFLNDQDKFQPRDFNSKDKVINDMRDTLIVQDDYKDFPQLDKKDIATLNKNGFLIKKSDFDFNKIPDDRFLVPNFLDEYCGNEPPKLNQHYQIPFTFNGKTFYFLPDKFSILIERKKWKTYTFYTNTEGVTEDGFKYKLVKNRKKDEFEAHILGRIEKNSTLIIPQTIEALKPQSHSHITYMGKPFGAVFDTIKTTKKFYSVIHVNPEKNIGFIQMVPCNEVAKRSKDKQEEPVMETYTVTAIEKDAFQKEQVNRLELPQTLLTIEKDAFANNKLQSVNLPENLEKLNGFAHNQLSFVRIPHSVKEIGDHAFANNNLYFNLSIPPSVEHIGDYAFNDNQLWGSLVTKASSIGDHAFANNDLNYLQLQADHIYIGNYAFANNNFNYLQLQDVNVNIGDYAFANNKLHNKLTITTEHIGDCAFSNNNLYSVDIKGHGFLPKIYIGKKAFIDNKIAELKLPRGINGKISERAFSGNQLKEILLPGVVKIGKNAFANNRDDNGESTIKYIYQLDYYKKNIDHITEFYEKGWYLDLMRKNRINGTVPLNGPYSRCYHTIHNNTTDVLEDWEDYFMFDFVNSAPDFIGENVANENHIYHLDEVFANALREGESGEHLSSINEHLSSEWHGSCYGFSLVRKFDIAGHLNLLNWTSTDGMLRTLKKPADELALFLKDNNYQKNVTNLINYYHISQRRANNRNLRHTGHNSIASPDDINDIAIFNSINNLAGTIEGRGQVLLYRVIENQNSLPMLLSISITERDEENERAIGGHAVLVLDFNEYTRIYNADDPRANDPNAPVIQFNNLAGEFRISSEITILDPNKLKYTKFFITTSGRLIYAVITEKFNSVIYVGSDDDMDDFDNDENDFPIVDIYSFYNIDYDVVTPITSRGPVIDEFSRLARSSKKMTTNAALKDNFLLVHLNSIELIIDVDNDVEINPHKFRDYQKKGCYIVPTSERPTDFVEFHLPQGSTYRVVFKDEFKKNSFKYVVDNESINMSARGMRRISLDGLDYISCPGNLVDVEVTRVHDYEPRRSDYKTRFSLKECRDLVVMSDLKTNSISIDGEELKELKILEDKKIFDIEDIKDNRFILDRSEENNLKILDDKRNLIKQLKSLE